MASEFAEKLVGRFQINNALSKRIALTGIDIALLEVSAALGHARHRNHDHNPAACDACAQLEKVFESIKIK